jgi:hypothetical protein
VRIWAGADGDDGDGDDGDSDGVGDGDHTKYQKHLDQYVG